MGRNHHKAGTQNRDRSHMLRRARTILRGIFIPAPEWEAAEELERQNARLAKQVRRLRRELRKFCDRVDHGEIKSVRTYQRFRRALAETATPDFSDIPTPPMPTVLPPKERKA